MDILALSRSFGVEAETGHGGDFPRFLGAMRQKNVLLLCDRNTRPLAEPLRRALLGNGAAVTDCMFPEAEPVADEAHVRLAGEAGAACDYFLAVGTGTLNDIAKYAGFLAHKPCGVLATAPSMDGFTSGVAALVSGGKKVTYPAQTVSHLLLDAALLAAAPNELKGAGVGDVLAKYCCLTDWRISSMLTGEPYNEEAASLMRRALTACVETVPALAEGDGESAMRLMEALVVSGYAMVVAGSSRPASGAEHHMSHFLEQDFLRRGERIPLHGVKVGLGTLVSLYLYHTLQKRPPFEGCEAVYAEAEKLPAVEEVEALLRSLGCPVRFSGIGVSEETVRRMLFEAYRIRDRFTILTLYCTEGYMKDAADEIVGRFY